MPTIDLCNGVVGVSLFLALSADFESDRGAPRGIPATLHIKQNITRKLA